MSKGTGAMTEKERVEAVLRREKPDRVPLWTFFDVNGFAAVYHKRPISDSYRDPVLSLAMQRKVCQDLGWVCSPLFLGFGAADFGGEVKLPESEFSQAPSVTRYPIASEEDINKLKMLNLRKSAGISRETEFYRLVAQERSDNEPFRIFLPIIPSTFEAGSMLCGLETFSRWLIKKPEVVHLLLRIVSDIMTDLLDYWYDAFGTEGVSIMSAGVTSSNQIISPGQFEQFALPYIKAEHQKILAKGYRHIYCHICGDHNLNLPYWAQVPMGDPGIVSIGHEVDLETTAEYFPDDIILGNLEPAILQTGTPEEVYKATRKVVEKGKRLAERFIFSLGCQLPPRTSLDNAKAMNMAVNDFGWYD